MAKVLCCRKLRIIWRLWTLFVATRHSQGEVASSSRLVFIPYELVLPVSALTAPFSLLFYVAISLFVSVAAMWGEQVSVLFIFSFWFNFICHKVISL